MAQRNPPWTKDEDILALDLYFRFPPSTIDQDHPEVLALSALLTQLPIHPLDARGKNFRNPNGVHMKMFNFQYIDPDVPGGLDAVAAMDEIVWSEFAYDRSRLEAVAQAIRAAVQPSAVQPVTHVDESIDEGVAEGRILLQLHRSRERNATLVRRKKEAAMKQDGKLTCEVCAFDFGAVYGDHGEGFIECHHRVPLAASVPEQKTKLSDFALVCANCHRMLHYGAKMVGLVELRSMINMN